MILQRLNGYIYVMGYQRKKNRWTTDKAGLDYASWISHGDLDIWECGAYLTVVTFSQQLTAFVSISCHILF